MSNPYNELLDSTIRHLEELKGRGVNFVSVSPETIRGLSSSPAAAQKPPVGAPKPSVSAVPNPAAASISTGAPQVSPSNFSATKSLSQNPSSSLAAEAKVAAFTDLRRRALACVKCPHLASSRKNVVFGVGDINAELMFVGEAPGADEDEQGEPFVGRAGQLLTKIIEAISLKREDVYIANVIKCRPPQNRNPEPDEVETCEPFLFRQIDVIKPKVIVALGKFGAQTLLRTD